VEWGMKINWNEASTKRGAVGLVLFVIGIFIVIFDDDYAGKITVLLLLGKGISDYMKFKLPDRKE
jgi:drug/metabolite transporter (DMT)-like permease